MRTSQRASVDAASGTTPTEGPADLWPSRASGARLHVVSGKGGVGKTTLSAALCLALAAGGRKVLLVEVEGRQSIANLFDIPELPYAETKVANAEGGGQVWALAIDVELAILEYFEMFYNLGFAAKAMRAAGAVDFITTIAPGLDDVVLTGKIYELVTRTQNAGKRAALGKSPRSGTTCYDAIVVDAPPTGRVGGFLGAAAALGELAKGGPIHRHAQNVATVLRSTDSVVHLATLLEALPVQETIEAAAELTALGLGLGVVLVNRRLQQYLDPDELAKAAQGSMDASSLRAGLGEAGLDLAEEDFAGLITETIDNAVTQIRQQEQAQALTALELPQLDLPLVPAGVDLGVLYELADRLVEQGVK